MVAVNFQDPAIVALDFLSTVKLWHTVGGLYIWEFVINLDYEWSVFQGRRPYLRTIWLYSLVRLSMLLFVILSMVGFDAMRPINCQFWVSFELVFAYLAIAGATLLIAIRTIAIWERSKVVIMVTMGIWFTNLGFLIQSIVRYRAFWSPEQGICVTANTAEGSKYNIVATLCTDLVLLLTMLIGLLCRRHSGGSSSLARLLWKQGVVWFILATVAEVPPTVFIFLNLNAPFNLMFQAPALITVSIAATRMYRSLTNFSSSNISSGGPPSRIISGANGSSTGPIPLKQMGVTVHTHTEQYGESGLQTSKYGLSLSKDRQLYDKP